MMKILLLETTIYGHYLEYIHHLHEGLGRYPECEMYLVLPPAFKEEREKYEWMENDRVTISYLSEEELIRVDAGGLLVNSWRRAKLIRKYIQMLKPDAVFLISIMSYMPFLPLIVPAKVRVYGILYKLYMYRWKNLSLLRKAFEAMHYYYMTRVKSINGLFVLNDKSSACFLNRKYRTNKFIYLPDPFNKISYKGKSLRSELGIGESDTVFLHFGAMTDRKGTLEILDAISLLSEMEKYNKVFIFAGVISESIKSQFYHKFERAKNGCRLFLFEGFCTNEKLVDLCVTTDFILCPYKLTDLSSGVLGYAATFTKQVIGPAGGLIGKLIRKYKLGVTLDEITSSNIADAITKVKKSFAESNYVQHIRGDAFVDTIFGALTSNI